MGTFNSKEIISDEILLPKFHPDLYKNIGELGTGGFGTVSKLERKSSSSKDGLPSQVAVKIIQVRSPIGDELREYKVLKECDHVNILKLFYWKRVEANNLPKLLYLYTELCDSNLREFVAANELDLQILKNICLQMIQGCSYLHSKSVVHRDLKPENILINKYFGSPKTVTVKIADFGLARFMPQDIASSFQYTTACTRKYASPEMIKAYNQGEETQPKRQFATDVFSVGVVIFEMFTKKLPFTIAELGKATLEVEKIVRVNITAPVVAKGLIKMLQWDPKLRSESKELTKLFSWQWLDVIYVENDICTLQYLPEVDVLIIGRLGGSICTINSEGEQNIFAQKLIESRWQGRINCIRHHDNIVAVADGEGRASLWKCSESGQLDFLEFLQEKKDIYMQCRIDISARYIVWGGGNSLTGELIVWERKTGQAAMTWKKVAEEKFAEGLFAILIHQDYVFCGLDSHVTIYDLEKSSIVKRLSLGDTPIISITAPADQIFLATWSSGIFCINSQFELKKVIEVNESALVQQILVSGEHLYCLLSKKHLKSFSLRTLSRSSQETSGPLNWLKDGITIVEGNEEYYDFSIDKCQVNLSTLFVVHPKDAKNVRILNIETLK